MKKQTSNIALRSLEKEHVGERSAWITENGIFDLVLYENCAIREVVIDDVGETIESP